MTVELVFRYLHFISLFFLTAGLLGEWFLVGKSMTRAEIKKLGKLDAIYGVASILAVGAGLTLWLGVGKPAEFYTQNPVFMTKLTLAIVLGLLSIHPTIFFSKQRKGAPDEAVEIPGSVIWLIRLEVLILFIIPLLAVLMARGGGAVSRPDSTPTTLSLRWRAFLVSAVN